MWVRIVSPGLAKSHLIFCSTHLASYITWSQRLTPLEFLFYYHCLFSYFYVFVEFIHMYIHTSYVCGYMWGAWVWGYMWAHGCVGTCEGPGLLLGVFLWSSSTFCLIHWGRVSQSNPSVMSMVSLVSQLAQRSEAELRWVVTLAWHLCAFPGIWTLFLRLAQQIL